MQMACQSGDGQQIHANCTKQLEREAQKSSRDRVQGQGRASATTMWHRCLLLKGCTGDGTESVHLRTLPDAKRELHAMMLALQQLQKDACNWRSRSTQDITAAARAHARETLPVPDAALVARCVQVGLVMPPSDGTGLGAWMQDNADELPPSLGTLTDTDLTMAHRILDPARWTADVTDEQRESWLKRLDGFDDADDMPCTMRNVPKGRHATGMGAEHVTRASKTVHAAVLDLCNVGFCGIASPLSKDALMSPVTKDERNADRTRPLCAMRVHHKVAECKVNKNQAEIMRDRSACWTHYH